MQWYEGLTVKDEASENQFELERELPKGHYGPIWLARKLHGPRAGLNCVLKQIDASMMSETDLVRQRRRQWRAARIGGYFELWPDEAGYENVVKIFGRGEWEGDSYLEMEYLPGESLKQRLAHRKGGLPSETVLAYALQLCDALHFLEHLPAGVVHRDIRASNIMLTPRVEPPAAEGQPTHRSESAGREGQERLVLIDFGAALCSDDTLDDPDAARDDPTSRVAYDIYLAALVIAEMRLGRSIANDLDEERLTVKQALPGDSPPFLIAVRQALEADPSKRPQTADAFRQALAAPQKAGMRERLQFMLKRTPPASAPASQDDMLLVPAGPFIYGADRDDLALRQQGKAAPRPQARNVEQKAFRIDPTPVTNRQYWHFINETKRKDVPYLDSPFAQPYNWDRRKREPPEKLMNHPVVLVTWAQAAAYAAFHNKRLPTEREWEKAARGTAGCIYPWGNEWDRSRCHNIENLLGREMPDEDTWKYWMKAVLFDLENWDRSRSSGDAPPFTAPVGAFPAGASPCGALDMVGNIWEWTADAPAESKDHRILRGGSWLEGRAGNRATARICEAATTRLPWIGFRCVADLRRAS